MEWTEKLLAEVWESLEQLQPQADEMGFGVQWRWMCEERTEGAAGLVSYLLGPEVTVSSCWMAEFPPSDKEGFGRLALCATGNPIKVLKLIYERECAELSS